MADAPNQAPNPAAAHTEVNRSSALSPEQQAQANLAVQTATQQAVQAAVAGVFAQLAPFLKDMALTPEKIQALKAPFIDPKVAAREAREAQNSREEMDRIRKETEWRRSRCPHKDKQGNESISVVHNQLDHQPRGVCMLCNDWIHPREWVFDAPDATTGKSKARIRDAHKDYPRVLAIESMS